MKPKNVLFLSVTKYNLEKDVHLRKKFEGLSNGIRPYVLAKGKLCYKKIWGTEFYLLPSRIFWLVAPLVAFWLCLAKKINTIVTQGPLLEGLLGTILKKLLRKELVVELHGDWEERLPALKGVLTFFAKRVLRSANKIRAVANYLIAKAQKYAPDKPYFLFPTFTDLDDFLQETDINFDNYILFVGRDDRVKGVRYLTEAFSKIERDFPEFRLVLIGEGLPGGKLSLEEVRIKMKDCYCLAVPSLSEGLPRVIMEAQALAKPVIASRVGGIPDLVKDGETGFLFESGNVEELAGRLRVLLSRKELAVEMGKQARLLVEEKFSNRRYLENYLKMIYS